MEGQKIYISGKITGLDYDQTYKKFENIEKQLKEKGATPINPMKLCPINPDWEWADYMEKDLGALLRSDAIYLMDNWNDSMGARCEFLVAKEIGLVIYYENQ